jgi:hypothetical protein
MRKPGESRGGKTIRRRNRFTVLAAIPRVVMAMEMTRR